MNCVPNLHFIGRYQPIVVGVFSVWFAHCGTQAVNQRKSGDDGKQTRTGDQSGTERDSASQAGTASEDSLGDEVVINAPSASGVSGTQIAGRFGTAPADAVSVDEAISVGADVLGAYLQVPPADIYSLTKPVIAEFPADPEGKRSVRLQVPLSTSFLMDYFDDEHAFDTSPQIGVVSLVRKGEQNFALETFRSNGRLKISEDGSHFIIRIKQPGSYQVVRLKSTNLPEKSAPTTQQPRRKK